MKRRIFLEFSHKGISLLGLFLLACSKSALETPLPSAKTMKLESSAFTDKQFIPKQYTCEGQDISPPLSWDPPPPDTQSLVLICDDPDAPRKTWVHWVVYNLPPQTRSLTEHISPSNPLPTGALEGLNDFGTLPYEGPCPPSGTHRYFFKLYALDTLLPLKAGATKAQVEQAIKGHILAQAELIGLYRRSY